MYGISLARYCGVETLGRTAYKTMAYSRHEQGSGESDLRGALSAV